MCEMPGEAMYWYCRESIQASRLLGTIAAGNIPGHLQLPAAFKKYTATLSTMAMNLFIGYY